MPGLELVWILRIYVAAAYDQTNCELTAKYVLVKLFHSRLLILPNLGVHIYVQHLTDLENKAIGRSVPFVFQWDNTTQSP